jgi:hypothetical protein
MMRSGFWVKMMSVIEYMSDGFCIVMTPCKGRDSRSGAYWVERGILEVAYVDSEVHYM